MLMRLGPLAFFFLPYSDVLCNFLGIKSPRASRWREKITKGRDLVEISAGISLVGIQDWIGKEILQNIQLFCCQYNLEHDVSFQYIPAFFKLKAPAANI